MRYWITGEKSRENVSREKKKKKERKKQFFARFPSFSLADTVIDISLLSLLSLFVITRESVKFSASANLMDGNGVKSGGKKLTTRSERRYYFN